MYVLLALFASAGGSFADIINKLNFRRNRIDWRQLMVLDFAGMSLSILAFIVVLHVPPPKASVALLLLTACMVALSFGGNMFDYLSLKADDVSLREPLVDLEPALAGLIGYIVFPSERRPILLLAFVACAFIAYWGTHRRRLGRLQSRGMAYLLISLVMYAMLPIVYPALLPYASPEYVALLRSLGILLLSALLFRKSLSKRLTSAKFWYAALSSLAFAAAAIANLYAIQKLGVVVTMLLMMLGPSLRYWASFVVLKEKVRRGEVIASVMMLVVVGVALEAQ